MQGKKQKINNYVFKREQKTGKVVADVTSVGRLFHKRLPATRKARSPRVTSLVAGTTSALDVEERSRRRFSSAKLDCFVPMTVHQSFVIHQKFIVQFVNIINDAPVNYH